MHIVPKIPKSGGLFPLYMMFNTMTIAGKKEKEQNENKSME